MKGGCGEKQNFYIPAPRGGGSASVQVAVMRFILFPTALNIALQIACKEWGFTRTSFNTVNPILVQGAALGGITMLAGFDQELIRE